jgi:hypothetical protein
VSGVIVGDIPSRRGGPALPTSPGLLSTVLRRSRSDWPVVLASWVLLVSALSLLAAGTLYTDAVTLAGLHRELADAPPADRSIVVRTKILPEQLDAAEAVIVPELDRVLAPTGGDLVRVLRSSPYADAAADPESVTDLDLFASYEGIEDHATLVEGRWPASGGQHVEATVSEPAATQLGLATGDRLSLVSRLDANRHVDVEITGTWRADPADPWWLGDTLALTGTETGGRFTTRGPFIVAADELRTGRLAESLDAQWRAIPSIAGYRPETLDEISTLAAGAEGRINAGLPSFNKATVSTKLPEILATVDRSVLVTQAGILLLLVQFGVLAGYAIILVAALLVERRRTETALLRARGAGFRHALSLAAGEALLVTVPAVLAAPWLASVLVVAIGLNPALAGVGLEAPLPGPSTFTVAVVGGLVAFIALTIPTVASTVSIAGVRAAVGRQVGRTLPQRLGLDLVLVALAALALFQLRLYGAPLTVNARGALGVDPLLVAAPAIGLLGGAVIAIRLVPRLAELAEGVLSRRPGLVPALGSRQLARRPLRYTRVALLLILAAALGTFASAHAATWTRSQTDQATYASGADVRLAPGSGSDTPTWALGGVLRAVPGVTSATPVIRASVDLGTTLRDSTLLAVDGAAMADIVRLRDDAEGAATIAALRTLGERRPETPGIALPADARRVAVTIDSAFTPVEGFEPVPDGYEGIEVAMLAIDGDGRLVRLTAAPAPMGRDGVVVEVPLTGASGEAVSPPVHVVAVQIAVSIGGVAAGMAQGHVDVHGLSSSPDVAGDAWTSLPSTGGRWTVNDRGNRSDYDPLLTDPDRLRIDGLFTSERISYVESFAVGPVPALPALVSRAFLDRGAVAVGDMLGASVFGVPVQLEIVGAIDAFPPLDQTRPFAVVDGLALDLARLDAGATVAETDEWWLAVEPGTSGAVAAAVTADPIGAEDVIDRAQVLAALEGDPLGLGVIGILGLGSVAALVFAAIGFLVSATVSTSERIGEFALLKAIGLSPRQLFAWLSMESVVLLVVGLVSGVLLGLVLAWLALPFATLTASGEAPVPAPDVIVPLEALLPTVILGAILVLATVLLVRRQLPAARTSAVLRARDE